MLSFRTLALGAVVAALVVVAPAVGDSGSARQSAAPPASLAGVDAAPLIPSLVNTRLVRAQASLVSATTAVDSGQPAQAVAPMGAATSNLTKAWNAAKYLIQSVPPVPPEEDALPDGPEEGALAYAGPEDTAFAVFSAQHDAVSTAVGMIETTNAALLTSLDNSIASAQTTRNTAIRYIATLAPPPEEDAVGPDGPEEGATWDTVMPNLIPVLDDELLQINGRLAMNKFSGTSRTALVNARTRAQNAKALVNQYWPVLGED